MVPDGPILMNPLALASDQAGAAGEAKAEAGEGEEGARADAGRPRLQDGALQVLPERPLGRGFQLPNVTRFRVWKASSHGDGSKNSTTRGPQASAPFWGLPILHNHSQMAQIPLSPACEQSPL